LTSIAADRAKPSEWKELTMPRVHHIKKAQKNNKAAGTKNGPGLLVGRVMR
jgi:hypothetical protein